MEQDKQELHVMSDVEFQTWWEKVNRFRLFWWIRTKMAEIKLWLWYFSRPKFTTTNKMGEISGFGGSYELGCRAMLKAGMYWLKANPNADPHYMGFKDVVGILQDDNEDATDLDEAMMKPVKGLGATGAMHQAVASRLLWIKGHSWEEYVVEAMKREKEE